MRGKENKKLTERIIKNWKTGRFKSYSSLARMMHLKYVNTVKRAVLRDAKLQEENQNSKDSLND